MTEKEQKKKRESVDIRRENALNYGDRQMVHLCLMCVYSSLNIVGEVCHARQIFLRIFIPLPTEREKNHILTDSWCLEYS